MARTQLTALQRQHGHADSRLGQQRPSCPVPLSHSQQGEPGLGPVDGSGAGGPLSFQPFQTGGSSGAGAFVGQHLATSAPMAPPDWFSMAAAVMLLSFVVGQQELQHQSIAAMQAQAMQVNICSVYLHVALPACFSPPVFAPCKTVSLWLLEFCLLQRHLFKGSVSAFCAHNPQAKPGCIVIVRQRQFNFMQAAAAGAWPQGNTPTCLACFLPTACTGRSPSALRMFQVCTLSSIE
jgi:hypothetical protein